MIGSNEHHSLKFNGFEGDLELSTVQKMSKQLYRDIANFMIHMLFTK